MSKVIGQAKTVQELIDLLKTLPPDKEVRSRSFSHEWPVVVEEHRLCVMVDMGS